MAKRIKNSTGKAKFAKLQGIDTVMNNINKQLKSWEKNVTNKGFIRVAMAIRQSTEASAPKTPVDTGNLRASWFTVIKGLGEQGTGNYPLVKPDKVRKKDLANQRSVVSTVVAISNGMNMPNMIFGYSANYAAIVHEMVQGDINWQREGSGPKWFQLHLERNKRRILTILAQNLD